MGVLYARVGGAWVPVGGAQDEVWVAADAPTDAGVELWYDTDDPGLGDMSRLPRGYIGAVNGTSIVNVAATITDVPGLSITFTADATRRYLSIVTIAALQKTVAGTIQIGINCQPAGLGTSIYATGAINQQQIMSLTHVIDGSAQPFTGTQTLKVQAATSAGTCDIISQAGQRAFLTLLDIGGV